MRGDFESLEGMTLKKNKSIDKMTTSVETLTFSVRIFNMTGSHCEGVLGGMNLLNSCEGKFKNDSSSDANGV
ncbi:hypothetical protein CCP2SC5_380007 [Azospirillaceae bacterium]